MRIAALFLGMIAGLFALLAPSALRIDLMSPFLEFWATTSNERLLGTIIWYTIAGAALVGGLLATVTPGFASLLLLGAAVGWLGIAISVPQLFTYHLLAPAAAAALGALFAFLAGELQVRRRRLARRSRKLAAEAPEINSEFEREAALRMDPLLMPRQDAPPPPKRPIPLTLSDVTVTSRPAAEPPRWQDLDAPPPPRRRDPDIWAEARREPSPADIEAPTRRSEPETIDVVRRPEPEPVPVRRAAAPATKERRPRRGGVLVGTMAAVAAVLVLGLLAAGGYLLYRDGTIAALLAPLAGEPAVVAAGDAPATATPLPAAPTRLAALPAAPAPSAAAAATPAASSTPVAEAPPATEAAAPPASAPQRVAAASTPESYDSPFDYCRAVQTIDYVDQRYIGPAVTEEMTRALLIPVGSPRDRVRWRCFDGAVLACTSYIGPICDMAPTVTEMREFCERNPNVEQLLAPSGPWSCADGKPQLPADASWPVDARGFLPQGWISVADPGTATAG